MLLFEKEEHLIKFTSIFNHEQNRYRKITHQIKNRLRNVFELDQLIGFRIKWITLMPVGSC